MAAIPKVQEPSMEEILASIRRIMADDDQPAPQSAPQRAAEPRAPTPRRPTEAAAPAFEAPEPAPARSEPRVGGQRPAPRPATEGAARPRPVSDAPDHDAREENDMNERPQPRREAFAAAPQPPARPVRPVTAAPESGADYDAPERAPVARGADPRAAQPRVDQNRMEQPRMEQPAPRRRPLPPEAEEQQAEADAEVVEALFRANGATRRDLLSPNVDAVVAAAFQSLGDLVLPQKERTVEDLVKEILRPMLKDWLDHNLPTIVEKLVRAEIERVARRGR